MKGLKLIKAIDKSDERQIAQSMESTRSQYFIHHPGNKCDLMSELFVDRETYGLHGAKLKSFLISIYAVLTNTHAQHALSVQAHPHITMISCLVCAGIVNHKDYIFKILILL